MHVIMVVCSTDHHQRPVFLDHLTLGHGSSIVVNDPEDSGHSWPRLDFAPDENVSLTQMNPIRLTVDDRSIYRI